MVLLKISPLISPELLDALYRAGHGDEIVLADAHFPAESLARKHNIRLVRCDGLRVADLLAAVLPLFPLDTFVKPPEQPLIMMAKVEGDDFDCSGTINTFKAAVQRGASLAAAPEIEFNERFAFYRRVAEKAYCIVQTGDTTKYGNIILKKGVCSWD